MYAYLLCDQPCRFLYVALVKREGCFAANRHV
jgi:hypothetical protein